MGGSFLASRIGNKIIPLIKYRSLAKEMYIQKLTQEKSSVPADDKNDTLEFLTRVLREIHHKRLDTGLQLKKISTPQIPGSKMSIARFKYRSTQRNTDLIKNAAFIAMQCFNLFIKGDIRVFLDTVTKRELEEKDMIPSAILGHYNLDARLNTRLELNVFKFLEAIHKEAEFHDIGEVFLEAILEASGLKCQSGDTFVDALSSEQVYIYKSTRLYNTLTLEYVQSFFENKTSCPVALILCITENFGKGGGEGDGGGDISPPSNPSPTPPQPRQPQPSPHPSQPPSDTTSVTIVRVSKFQGGECSQSFILYHASEKHPLGRGIDILEKNAQVIDVMSVYCGLAHEIIANYEDLSTLKLLLSLTASTPSTI